MRPVGVARHLTLPPGIEVLVEVLEDIRRLLVKRGGFLLDVHLFVLARQCAQFLGLAFDLGQGLFELEIVHVTLRSGPRIYEAGPAEMQLMRRRLVSCR